MTASPLGLALLILFILGFAFFGYWTCRIIFTILLAIPSEIKILYYFLFKQKELEETRLPLNGIWKRRVAAVSAAGFPLETEYGLPFPDYAFFTRS